MPFVSSLSRIKKTLLITFCPFYLSGCFDVTFEKPLAGDIQINSEADMAYNTEQLDNTQDLPTEDQPVSKPVDESEGTELDSYWYNPNKRPNAYLYDLYKDSFNDEESEDDADQHDHHHGEDDDKGQPTVGSEDHDQNQAEKDQSNDDSAPEIDPDVTLDARFPDQHYCDHNTVLLAESMSLPLLENLCSSITAVSNTFHQTMQTHYQVNENDHNDLVEIRIFDTYFDYLEKIKDVSGLDFASSGGFFYEGNAAKEGNRAKIYVFEKTFTNGVWNLEHEYIHHLNARFVKYGNVSNREYYLFWEEGMAEYFSQPTLFHDAKLALDDSPTIQNIININIDSTQTEIYGASYWLIRFLIEEHTATLHELAYLLKQGDFDSYEDNLDTFAIKKESEFQSWLNTFK